MYNLMITDMLLLTTLSVIPGLWCGFLGWKCLRSSKGMILTLMALPSLVCAALLAINGSLGTGIAILGVFGLVRFRSLPGSGPDIAAVFLGMVSGLLFSTGYILAAVAVTFVLGLVLAAAAGLVQRITGSWTVRILIPEDTESFEPYTRTLQQFGKSVRLEKVRSMNMGTMYELEYSLLPDLSQSARMIEEIRLINHNLNVQLCEGSSQISL
ncbi:DUF4956 domain-containing protein [uncultured Faecalibaculum sp.]|uniref:DUF4956 domain-containing protein n=1 Tax=uncultured Faecalibaculum sp. TaxID=1729681 RepID=UPI00260A40B7|nr:DUF4956 domain-containing protein [uncultured Faecalibaculum sp.]